MLSYINNYTDITGINETWKSGAVDSDEVEATVRLMHQIGATTISVLGSCINFVTIIMIVRSRLYKQTAVIFILNLIVHNFLISVFCLPTVAYESFHEQYVDAENHCRALGFITYSILGSDIMAVLLISINRYVLIVHFKYYQKIYTTKGIRIMFLISWLIVPFFCIFPLTETWGSFRYDSQRFICHPLASSKSFNIFLILFVLIMVVPIFVYCYIRIVYTVVLQRRKVNAMRSNLNEDKLRKHDTQLLVTVVMLLTTFAVVYLPFFILGLLDPSMSKYDVKLHVAFVYFAWLHCIVNAIVYTVTSQQIKQAYVALLCCHSNQFKVTENTVIKNIQLEIKIDIKRTSTSEVFSRNTSQTNCNHLQSMYE